MSAFALIVDGTVFEVVSNIDPAFPRSAVWVDVTSTAPQPAPGWQAQFSVGAWKFTAPIVSDLSSAAPSTSLTRSQFMARFTAQEMSALQTAAMSNVAFFNFFIVALAADSIDLNDPLVKSGLDAAVTAGLLTQARETAIMTP